MLSGDGKSRGFAFRPGRRVGSRLVRCSARPRRGFSSPPARAIRCTPSAGLAQLVEHELPKLGVTGSSPVSRSEKAEPWFGRGAGRNRGLISVVAPAAQRGGTALAEVGYFSCRCRARGMLGCGRTNQRELGAIEALGYAGSVRSRPPTLRTSCARWPALTPQYNHQG